MILMDLPKEAPIRLAKTESLLMAVECFERFQTFQFACVTNGMSLPEPCDGFRQTSSRWVTSHLEASGIGAEDYRSLQRIKKSLEYCTSSSSIFCC